MRFVQLDQTLIVHAPAKLNLFLEIQGKRDDGFHEIETVMVSIGVYDSLQISLNSSRDISLTCEFPGLPETAQNSLSNDDDNLVIRAAKLLLDATGLERGANIRLIKRIPMQAGLGGGSSDAAATLVGLNCAWNLQLSFEQLSDLAAQLGSDVNFFLATTPVAVGRGRGEQIQPISNTRELSFVVVKPDYGLSTADVYRGFQKSNHVLSSNNLIHALQSGDNTGLSRSLHNALESPACLLNSNVRDLLSSMSAESFLGVMMSGSGSACFGVCRNHRHAQRIASRLRCQNAGRVFVARSTL